MITRVASAVLCGVAGAAVDVEVHVDRGLPAYSLVGLPDASGRESRDRVRAALCSSDFEWPLQRITVNLAPASVRKHGSGFELAIALGLLVSDERLPPVVLEGVGVIGELGLDGSVRPVDGTFALTDALARNGCGRVIVPLGSAHEASLVPGIEVLPAQSVAQVRASLKAELAWPAIPTLPPSGREPEQDDLDLAEVRGLAHARTALEACATGSHHLLIVGPPGAGKSMLAHRLRTILPELTDDEAIEVARIRSAAGDALTRLPRARPFRAPHHTVSAAALVGGGSPRPGPGEVTRAHMGVLFLDELTEFGARTLDALRQPLEARQVQIARATGSIELPADVVLVACANPCACGRPVDSCRCTEPQRARYRHRVSGPLLDRFDLRVRVSSPSPDARPGPSSATVRARVQAAIARQTRRYAARPWDRNAHVAPGALDEDIPLGDDALDAWRDISETRALSGRGAARLRRVARTVADLADVAAVRPTDIEVASSMRSEVLG